VFGVRMAIHADHHARHAPAPHHWVAPHAPARVYDARYDGPHSETVVVDPCATVKMLMAQRGMAWNGACK
jgi:hypothetical protein